MTSPYGTYLEFARQRQLAYQVDSVESPVFYPRIVDPVTGEGLNWKISKGLGTVYSTTTIHERDGTRRNIALIDLDEGYRMMSSVEGIASEEVKIGMRVEVFFRSDQDNVILPFFQPSEAPNV